MRKAATVLLTLVLAVFCLTGCHSSVPKPGEIDGYDEGEQYLSLWVHSIEDTDEGRCYRDSVNSFNEEYNGQYFADIEFIPRNDSGGGYSDKINASVMSGDLPDVLTVDGPNIAAYAMNGIIQPLAPLTEAERDIYLDTIIEQGTYQGELYALGVLESTVGFYCNKNILKKAGVEIPDKDHPWTWSEFKEVCEKCRPVTDELGGYVLDLTFPVGEMTIYSCSPFWWTNGGNMVDDEGLNAVGIFNSKENAEGTAWLRTLVDEGIMSAVPVTDLFESGRAAFKVDGTWEVKIIYDDYPDVDLGVVPYIVSDNWNGEPYVPSGSWAFAASTRAQDLEGATKLVQWMTNVPAGVAIWDATTQFPSTYEAFELSPDFQTDPNCAELYYQLSNYGRPRPKTPVYPQISSSFQKVLEDCVITGLDIQDTLDAQIPKIEAKLKRYVLEAENEREGG